MANTSGLKQLELLLTPSWLSAFIGVTTSLVVSVGAVVLAHQSGAISQDIFAFHGTAAVVDASYQTVVTNLSRNQLLNDLPLVVFYAGIGLIVYFSAIRVVKTLSSVVKVEQELHYVNTERRSLLSQVSLSLLTRLAALVVWVLLLISSFHMILPYDLASAHSLARHFDTAHVLAAVAGFCLVVIDLTLQTICLRLFFLRPRLFETLPEE